VTEIPHRNRIDLVGRVTAEPARRELSAGRRLVTWRLAMTRRAEEQRAGAEVDAVNCVSFDPRVHAGVRGWTIGDVVQVQGALRRRFWRTSAGTASFFEVEAEEVRRLAAGTENQEGSGCAEGAEGMRGTEVVSEQRPT
jgi:single-strand DNA-binding protein